MFVPGSASERRVPGGRGAGEGCGGGGGDDNGEGPTPTPRRFQALVPTNSKAKNFKCEVALQNGSYAWAQHALVRTTTVF